VSVIDNTVEDVTIAVEAAGGLLGHNSALTMNLTHNDFKSLNGAGLLVYNEESSGNSLHLTADDNEVSAGQLDPLPPWNTEPWSGVWISTQEWYSYNDAIAVELTNLEIADYPVGIFIQEGWGGGPTWVDLADIKVEDTEIDLKVSRAEPSGLTVTVDGVVRTEDIIDL
jgi:hypothetical protein